MQTHRIERVLGDLERATAAAQDILETGSARATELGGRLGRSFADTTGRVIDFERAAVRRVRDAADEVDRYAHEHPWRTVAAGALIVAIAAVALSLLQSSRR
jgi:ElaB/YqjD/DUF883 family membrane-anchored ribosome-binding protein